MRHGRIDANQTEIVQALRQVGASVQSLADIGKGCADLLVGYHGRDFVLEVKAAKGELTPAEVEWIQGWRGNVHVVRTIQQALDAIGAT